MNSDLYRRCKLRGYHLPILSGKDMVELPGRTEKVEMAFSNVFVDISSNHCVAQVFLTNYRCSQGLIDSFGEEGMQLEIS